MKTPLIAVNDIGDIFFLDEQGNELYAPRGSFEPENLEAFEAIAEACNSHDALVALAEQRDGAVTEACERLKALELQRDTLVAALTSATVMLEAIEAHCVNERGLKGMDHADEGRRGRAAMQAIIPELRAALNAAKATP